jgi:hypothetical protein
LLIGSAHLCTITSAADIYVWRLFVLQSFEVLRAALSTVNLSYMHSNVVIDMIEAIGYVAIGFAGTLAAMEAAWRIARRQPAMLEVRAK